MLNAGGLQIPSPARGFGVPETQLDTNGSHSSDEVYNAYGMAWHGVA